MGVSQAVAALRDWSASGDRVGFVSPDRGADAVSDWTPTCVTFPEQVFGECLEAFPEVVFAVTGHCMRPDLAEGDRVRVVGPGRRRPRFGDVVLTRRAGDLRLHRLVWRPPFARASWRTKADRAFLLDPSLLERDVIGTVVAVEGRAFARRPGRALRSLLEAIVVRAFGAGVRRG
jgi:hypothetical protein